MILVVLVVWLFMVSDVSVLASLMSEFALLGSVDVGVMAALMMFTAMMTVVGAVWAVLGSGHSAGDESEKGDKLRD